MKPQQEIVLHAELEQIYRQHRQTLFSLALTITGCSGLAEDAIHEAFVRMCRLTSPPTGSVAAYVFSSVRNAAIDFRRHQQRHQAALESIFAAAKDRQETDVLNRSLETAESQHQLTMAIDRLDESARQILVMKIFGELTFEEIAEVLQEPAATVATRYRRSILKLEEIVRKSP